MRQEQYIERNCIQNDSLENDELKKKRLHYENLQTDALEHMLISIYQEEAVPDTMKIRLQNRIACQHAMETEKVSFWWLPATAATAISIVTAVFLCLTYVIVNMVGAHSWMPNFLQFTSGIWLKTHLLAISLEIVTSWVITFLGVWKGNLIKSAKIM